jgi:prepilin-type N-terminal cleavage/methylation domain-containing protein
LQVVEKTVGKILLLNKTRASHMKQHRTRGFTLVEALCVIVVISLLAGLGHGAYSRVQNSSKKVAEINAAKNLIQAYLLASEDNQGVLLKGYDLAGSANDSRGTPFSSRRSESHRWPWRLAPYLNYQLYGTVLVNEVEDYIQQIGGLDSTYMVSVIPSLGMNAGFVGGQDYEEDLRSLQTRGLCVQRAVQSASPSKLIVFISSKSEMMGKKYKGFYYSTSPLYPSAWPSQFQDSIDPSETGYVDPRFGGKAVVACLAGNVEELSYQELKDMRRWANEAARQDNPNWKP